MDGISIPQILAQVYQEKNIGDLEKLIVYQDFLLIQMKTQRYLHKHIFQGLFGEILDIHMGQELKHLLRNLLLDLQNDLIL